jgi:hypothetical protein
MPDETRLTHCHPTVWRARMMQRQRIAWTRADKKPRQVGEHAPRLMQTNGSYADEADIL